MKVLLVNSLHHKNLSAIMKYKIDITNIHNTNLDNIDLTQFDVVYNPSYPIDVSKYPNTKFMFGPHFSVFPNKNQIDMIKGNKNYIYVMPSDWVIEFWKNLEYSKDLRMKSLPFGVDTQKFNEIKPINDREKVFIYVKRRHPNELKLINDFLKKNNISAKVFDYVKRYDEDEYINYLHHSKYGIWLDAHESQGFALEEALSCNVPLLVWNVVSMNQEYNFNYPDIPATTIPYWDERCGYKDPSLEKTLQNIDKMRDTYSTFRPREFILEHVSPEKCAKRFQYVLGLEG
jgi:hypothetical protein